MSDPAAAVWRHRFNFKINYFFSTLIVILLHLHLNITFVVRMSH